MTRFVGALFSAVALVGTVAPGAMAQDLECGAQVTSDIILQASLVGCSTGLVVAADGVTIDLNGFAVEGVGLSAGIDASHRTNVTIKNGLIRGFGSGVAFSHTSGSTIENVTVEDSSSGISMNQSHDNRVYGNSLINNSQSGLKCILDGSGNLIDSNYVSGNENGIWLWHCWFDAVVVNNVLVGNRLSGLYLEQSEALVERNVANSNGAWGIFSELSIAHFVKNVTNSNGRDGLLMSDLYPWYGPFNSVTGHVANTNAGYGIATNLVGVIDGGKNRAHANRGAAECLGIVCNS
jgi:parallel beta-helix repeat protein